MKVVINSCFGGFGLSNEALIELYRLESPAVKTITPKEYYGGKDLKFLNSDWEEKLNNDIESGWVCFHDGKILLDNARSTYEFNYRSDPKLVKVVKKMRGKANGNFAKLKIVEIPDGVEFEIDDYDGVETIHETHRSWS